MDADFLTAALSFLEKFKVVPGYFGAAVSLVTTGIGILRYISASRISHVPMEFQEVARLASKLGVSPNLSKHDYDAIHESLLRAEILNPLVADKIRARATYLAATAAAVAGTTISDQVVNFASANVETALFYFATALFIGVSGDFLMSKAERRYLKNTRAARRVLYNSYAVEIIHLVNHQLDNTYAVLIEKKAERNVIKNILQTAARSAFDPSKKAKK
jgi:hypothetical protein